MYVTFVKATYSLYEKYQHDGRAESFFSFRLEEES
jgi:hypothetical protein